MTRQGCRPKPKHATTRCWRWPCSPVSGAACCCHGCRHGHGWGCCFESDSGCGCAGGAGNCCWRVLPAASASPACMRRRPCPSSCPGRSNSTSSWSNGRVLDLPQHEPRRTRFEFRVDAMRRRLPALRGKRLQLAWYDDFKMLPGDATLRACRLHAGSRWRLCVKLRAPRGLRNPGRLRQRETGAGRSDCRHRLPARHRRARRLRTGRGIDAGASGCPARIASAMPTPIVAFHSRARPGRHRAIDDADWDDLRAVGVTHLIAISGFHVGIVAGFFALLVSLAWRLFPRSVAGCRASMPPALAALAGAIGYAASPASHCRPCAPP